MSDASFTAVVVIHDSEPDLAVLLDSLERHLPAAPQVVVVDTGSRDGGAELARARGAEVIDLPDNPGFGAANNAGVERASADVTVLLNPDVELLDAGLSLLAAFARVHEALHAPRLLNADGSVQRSAHPLPGQASALLPALLPGRLLPVGFEPYRARAKREVGWAIGACLAAPTALLRRLGPFDPEPFLFYEDLDLCLRARAAGVPTVLPPGGHPEPRRRARDRARVRRRAVRAAGPPPARGRRRAAGRAGAAPRRRRPGPHVRHARSGEARSAAGTTRASARSSQRLRAARRE